MSARAAIPSNEARCRPGHRATRYVAGRAANRLSHGFGCGILCGLTHVPRMRREVQNTMHSPAENCLSGFGSASSDVGLGRPMHSFAVLDSAEDWRTGGPEHSRRRDEGRRRRRRLGIGPGEREKRTSQLMTGLR